MNMMTPSDSQRGFFYLDLDVVEIDKAIIRLSLLQHPITTNIHILYIYLHFKFHD